MTSFDSKRIMDTWVIDPFNRFIKNDKTSGLILFIAAVIALVLANSPWKEFYHNLWKLHLSIDLHIYSIDKSLHHWINEGLMAIFFFVVGLELKREIVAGELRSPKKAILPIVAAIGGMMIPALIYLLFNSNDNLVRKGWGIPMATDIAFALGVLYFLGDKVPKSLKIFLTAIAIADDLGAVLVIAFFYTSHIDIISLIAGAIILTLMIGGNLLGIRNVLFYGILGIGGLWLAFLMSGVHATIAAVLAAFTIPASTRINEKLYMRKSHMLFDEFTKSQPNEVSLVTHEQYEILNKVRKLSKYAIPPLQRLEHNLHPFVAFFILPIFALCNAGISLSGDIFTIYSSSVSLGIIVGLIAGKVIGIAGTTFLFVKSRWIKLPENMTMQHVIGLAFLGAIGFTMSLFISDLSFSDPHIIAQAKLSVITASILAGLIGYWIIKGGSK